MKQLGFYIDSSRCSGCKTCQVSCKDKNDIDVGRKFRRVYEYGGGSWAKDSDGAWTNQTFAYYLSVACNHCDDPICVAGCPTQAMHKRQDNGLVLVDQDKCIGCRYCAMRCPYGAPQYDKEKKVMSKCDGCLDRLEQGLNLCASIHALNERLSLVTLMSYVPNMATSVMSRHCLTHVLPVRT